MKSLITGGTGFIGWHLVERLLKENHEVIIIDNLSTSMERMLPDRVKLYKQSIVDETIGKIFEEEKPDYVYHLAAQISVQRSMQDPYKDCLSNIAGTINLLQHSSKHKVKNFIFASSAAVYGEPKYLPIDELHSKQSLSFYSLSKNTAEEYILLFNKVCNMKFGILRFSNVYGPGQNVDGEAGVISIFIDQLTKGKNPVLYGGNQTRDFIYVKDVVDAMYKVSTSIESGIFNVSTNSETTIKDLLSMIQKSMSRETVMHTQPPRAGDIQNSRLDNSRIIQELNWRPKVALSEGIKFTLQESNQTYAW